jgi:hypothetical protein
MTISRAVQTVLMMLSAISTNANAYDATEQAKAALDRLATVDCATQPGECRYFAAVETVAFVQVCPSAFAQKFHMGVEGLPELKSALQKWPALEPAELKAAVLAPHNDLRRYFELTAYDYLVTLPADELGIECSRINVVLDGVLPEKGSDILKTTKNYEAWHTK